MRPGEGDSVKAVENSSAGVEGTTPIRVDDGSPASARRLPSIGDRVVRGNSAFAFALFKRTCGTGEGKNVFISPLSVSVALAMTYNGASGKTAEEMSGVLGFAGIAREELNRSMADLTSALAQTDSSIQLIVANSLWGRRGFEFRPEFIERNATYYHAVTQTLDFSDPRAPATINRWVETSTRGLIDRIITAIPRDAVLYLINAIYFKGRWHTEFDPATTSERAFRLADASEKTVPMMNRSGSFRYAEDAGLQVVRLPYGTGRVAMYVFLPGERDGLAKLVGGIGERFLTEWVGRLGTREGDVFIPRFKIAYECGLVPALKALGMKDAFDGYLADFSAMSDQALVISEVKHKAVVDVNEEGTEAAAVTSIEMKATSVSEPRDRFTFIADHPFFFTIRDDATGSILFMGTLYDPPL